MNGDPIARRAGTQSRISGSILTTDRGPSSQLSGPIAGFLACVEDAQRLRLPSAPSPRRGPTGLHRTQFRNPNRKSRKREKGKRSEAKCFLSRTTRLPQQKLCTICKFRMIFVALIPVKSLSKEDRNMTTYGYARVSTNGQDLGSQEAELLAAGCAKVFKEKASGAKTDRAELAKLIRR